MTRVVGNYKGEDIFLESLHQTKTYGGFIFISAHTAKHPERINKGIIEGIPANLRKIWGDREFRVFEEDKLVYDKPLPFWLVYAWLYCWEPVHPGSDGSHLILAWFQDPAVDPFAKISEILKTYNWEEVAKDYLL